MSILPPIDMGHVVSFLLPSLLVGGVIGAGVAWRYGRWRKLARRTRAMLAARNQSADSVKIGPVPTGTYSELLVRLQSSIEGGRHGDGAPVLFVLNLDNFRYINDGFGHAAGDVFLAEVAKRISKQLRPEDMIAKAGGDEFMIMVNRVTSAAAARDIAHRLYDAVGKDCQINGQRVRLTVSLGMAMAPRHGQTAEELTRSATAALTMVKRRGGDGVQLPTIAVTTDAAERLILENDLRRALERDEFEVHYQPKFTLADHKLTGVEALLRWRHPERGLVPPGIFIPVAEETGVIAMIGDWVLREALAASVRWREILKDKDVPPIAVNLSFKQFEQPDFFLTVMEAVGKSGARATDIEFELTESLVMHNPETTMDILHQIRSLGVGLSVDDFGTGHSSLAILKDLPVQSLKIDRSFLRGVPQEEASTAIVDAIIAMADSLKLKVIAEGVENEAQLEFLRSRKCDAVQGYLLSRPMPELQMMRFLTQNQETRNDPPPATPSYLRIVAD